MDPALTAARNGDVEFFRQSEIQAFISCRDSWGESVLGDAVYYNHLECAKVILERCPELLYVSNSYGQTPLHYAVTYSKKPEMVKLLIDGAEEKLFPMLDRDGKTALQTAVESLNVQIVNMLNASQTTLVLLSDTKVDKMIASEGGKKAYVDLQLMCKAYADLSAKTDKTLDEAPKAKDAETTMLEEKFTRLLHMYKEATGLEPSSLDTPPL